MEIRSFDRLKFLKIRSGEDESIKYYKRFHNVRLSLSLFFSYPVYLKICYITKISIKIQFKRNPISFNQGPKIGAVCSL